MYFSIMCHLPVIDSGSISHLVGQLSVKRVTLDFVFDKVGVVYAGPFQINWSGICQSICCVFCFFICLNSPLRAGVRLDHQGVSLVPWPNFLHTQRTDGRMDRRGHRTNFMETSCELEELMEFSVTQKHVSDLCKVEQLSGSSYQTTLLILEESGQLW